MGGQCDFGNFAILADAVSGDFGNVLVPDCEAQVAGFIHEDDVATFWVEVDGIQHSDSTFESEPYTGTCRT